MYKQADMIDVPSLMVIWLILESKDKNKQLVRCVFIMGLSIWSWGRCPSRNRNKNKEKFPFVFLMFEIRLENMKHEEASVFL